MQFSQEFDPTDTLMQIAEDPDRIKAIFEAPDEPVPLSYIVNDLWPKIGFLPPPNMTESQDELVMPGFELIAEFMLNELILKYSDSLDNCVLLHLKELFSRDGAEEDDEEMEAAEIAKAQEEMRLE